MHNEQNDRDNKEHPGYLRCDSGDIVDTQRTRDEPENKKNKRVIQHKRLLAQATLTGRSCALPLAQTLPRQTVQ
jgi:hypothetical protein